MQFVYCYYYRKLSTASSIQYEIDDNIAASLYMRNLCFPSHYFLFSLFSQLFFCFTLCLLRCLLHRLMNNFQGSVGRFDVIVNYVQGAASNFGQSRLRDREIASLLLNNQLLAKLLCNLWIFLANEKGSKRCLGILGCLSFWDWWKIVITVVRWIQAFKFC